MAGAHLARAVVHRAHRPRLGEHSRKMRAERGRARIAGLEVVQALRQIRREARSIDRVLPQDERAIAIGRVEQLHEEVLDLDVVVRSRQAQPRRRFDGAARRGVELGDESSEVDRHGGIQVVEV